jgi:hypothetical protein
VANTEQLEMSSAIFSFVINALAHIYQKEKIVRVKGLQYIMLYLPLEVVWDW